MFMEPPRGSGVTFRILGLSVGLMGMEVDGVSCFLAASIAALTAGIQGKGKDGLGGGMSGSVTGGSGWVLSGAADGKLNGSLSGCW
jgi:hypothetical protein